MSRWPADRARTELLRALEPHAAPFTVIGAESRDWASALFLGARHRLALRLEGDGTVTRAERLRARLSEEELDLRGGFVADIELKVVLVDGATILGIEALTIEEAETLALSRAARPAG
jgi:hypothetical protein